MSDWLRQVGVSASVRPCQPWREKDWSTAGTLVAYAIPSYAYVKTFKGDPERKIQVILARCVFAYSVVAVPACLYATFRP